MTFRIAFVCLGNICRSPMAHVVLEAKLAEAGLADDVVVTSSGTGDWHLGKPMDERAAGRLTGAGYDPSRHRARQFSIDWYAENDLLLAMDRTNRADMIAQSPTIEDEAKVRMFREWDPEAGPDDDEVPDPWFGADDGFDTVLTMVQRTCDALVADLAERITR